MNHFKSLTEATSNTTKIVFHYLVRTFYIDFRSIYPIFWNMNFHIEFKVWSFKNTVIMDKLVSLWAHNEKVHVVNKQEASETQFKMGI